MVVQILRDPCDSQHYGRLGAPTGDPNGYHSRLLNTVIIFLRQDYKSSRNCLSSSSIRLKLHMDMHTCNRSHLLKKRLQCWSLQIDFWKPPSGAGIPVDLMLSPQHKAVYKTLQQAGLNPNPYIKDVQRSDCRRKCRFLFIIINVYWINVWPNFRVKEYGVYEILNYMVRLVIY